MHRNSLTISGPFSIVTRAISTLLLATCTTTQALPVMLSQSEFFYATSGLPAIVEDFQAFDFGNHPVPLALANGIFHVEDSPAGISAGNLRCQKSLPDKCLFAPQSIFGTRTFSALPPEATFWGADLILGNPTDAFNITVVGASGVVNLSSVAGSPFFGFFDASGLVSIALTNIGDGAVGGQYSFDNVTTANGASVPTPSTLAIFVIGLIGAGLSQRLRSSINPS